MCYQPNFYAHANADRTESVCTVGKSIAAALEIRLRRPASFQEKLHQLLGK
jgi:hypothetical protein